MKLKIATAFLLLFSLNSCFIATKGTLEVPVDVVQAPKEIQDSTITRLQLGTNEIQDTSVFSLHYTFYKQPKSLWQDTINYKIAEFIHYSTHFERDSSVSFTNVSDRYFEQHLDYYFNTANEIYEQDEYKLLWSYEADCVITDTFPQIVQLSNSIYNFTGGAHGLFYSETVYFLKENGKRLLLKDFVKDTSAFNLIAEKYFRKAVELTPEDDLNEAGFWFADNIFACNDNFTFDRNEIYFFYNNYEIAPYAMGSPSFSIPLAEIKHLLNNDLLK